MGGRPQVMVVVVVVVGGVVVVVGATGQQCPRSALHHEQEGGVHSCGVFFLYHTVVWFRPAQAQPAVQTDADGCLLPAAAACVCTEAPRLACVEGGWLAGPLLAALVGRVLMLKVYPRRVGRGGAERRVCGGRRQTPLLVCDNCGCCSGSGAGRLMEC
jgi:hypothetical protein